MVPYLHKISLMTPQGYDQLGVVGAVTGNMPLLILIMELSQLIAMVIREPKGFLPASLGDSGKCMNQLLWQKMASLETVSLW